MGQIANEKSVINRANLRKLSDTSANGLANYVPAAGEIILISSDNSMTSTGQGNFDCFIKGDGSTAAAQLELKPIADGGIRIGENNAVNGQTVLSELRAREERTNLSPFIKGGFFNSDCEFVSNGSLYYIDHLDLTGYASITVTARARVSAYNFILDANENVLLRWQNNTSPYTTVIDLAKDYPTAKYACLSDYGGTNPHVDGVYYDQTTTAQNIAALKQSMKETKANVDAGTNALETYWDIPVTPVTGYINSSGAFVNTSYQCVKELDISGYSRLSCWGYSYGTAYSALYDENMGLLALFQSGSSRNFTVDLSLYPTAKYISVSSVETNLSIGGFKKNKIADILFNVALDNFFNQQIIKTELLEGFYNGYRKFNSSTNRQYKSNLIAVKEGYHVNLSSKGDANTINYISYDADLNPVAIVKGQTINEQIVVPSGVSFYEFFSYPSALVVDVEEFIGGSGGGSANGGNILYGKSYVAIGDSFTAPIGSETIDSGMYAGMSKVYPYIIGNRNEMSVINQGASGSVLNGYLRQARYNDIPQNVDYITIWYGINDAGHNIAVGTIDDEPTSISAETDTTTCGGFNFFFKWLLTNRPLAHIGVIITNFANASRREAIIACCEKWGIAYLDLYDPTVPMIRDRGTTQYPHSTSIAPLGYVEVCAEAKTLRASVFSTDPANSNIHPNNTCHEWQSNLIENFMRGL